MRRIFLTLAILTLWATSMCAQEREYRARHDSLMVYQSWESIFNGIADTLIMNPEVLMYTPYDIEFDGIRKNINKMLKDETVAVALGDSLWFVNTNWLKKNFKGESKHMSHYVPLYFSAKVAFVQWAGSSSLGWRFLEAMRNGEATADEYNKPGMIYLINFENGLVEKVDSKKLSELLSDYPDLQRRYESMRDYDKPYIINDFFLQYVQRLGQDPSVPYLF